MKICEWKIDTLSSIHIDWGRFEDAILEGSVEEKLGWLYVFITMDYWINRFKRASYGSLSLFIFY